MISLNLKETIEAEKKRQIEDLKICSKLWEIYEEHKPLMRVLQQICQTGAGITASWLTRCARAVGESDMEEFCEKKFLNAKKQKALDEVKFMDCFEGKSPKWKDFADMQKRPEVWFSDIGKIGGWFRVHAELSEHMCNFVLAALNLKRDPNIDNEIAKTRFGLTTTSSKLADKYTRIIAMGRPDPKLNLSTPDVIAILDREYEGRLSHQVKLARRVLKSQVMTPGGKTFKLYAYTAEWFGKWQYKGETTDAGYQTKLQEAATSEQQFLLQRARRSESGLSIPPDLRKYIRVPTHLRGTPDMKTDKGWQFSGIIKWRQMEWDRLWQISQLYGLPRGATISGTTTDHQFAIYETLTHIETLGTNSNISSGVKGAMEAKGLAQRIQQLLPYLHLVPVIQMGSQMHHSLCEMGTALSLNDFIEYHVGYYTTLLPPADKGMMVYDVDFDKKVREALAAAESAVTHMYAISEKKRAGLESTKHAAWACNTAGDILRHKAKAELTPETVDTFEKITLDHDQAFILAKAREIDPNVR
jgi:hypothetical protein